MNKICNKIQFRDNPNDVIYTPKPVALKMIDMCDIKPSDKVLDCSRGAGIFYNNFPECEKDWAEITEGRDFFKYTEGKKYDWVIGNPPYSLWTKWLEHTCNITDKFCYIFGTMNLTEKRLHSLHSKGFGITKIILCKIDWWFGHSYLILFEKNKPSLMGVIEDRVVCDICGKRCKRGRKYKHKKYGMNECSNII